jgi:hypothetical protein
VRRSAFGGAEEVKNRNCVERIGVGFREDDDKETTGRRFATERP